MRNDEGWLRKDGIIEGRAQPLANNPHVCRVGGLLFLSEASARQPDGSVPESIAAQTEALIANLAAVLEGAGTRLEDLAEITTFLTDMDDLPGYNAVWNRHFDAATGPARTTVAVKALPKPAMLIEMRAVASARD